MNLKPITLAPSSSPEPGTLQQLQDGDDLDIPLAERVVRLEHTNRLLVTFLLGMGFEVPPDLIASLEV